MQNSQAFCRVACYFALLTLVALSAAAEEPAQSHAIYAQGYYAREQADGDWEIRITGVIPSLCGAYVVIHDAGGTVVHHGIIPNGEYPPEKPYIVRVPADGITGDYKLVLVGQQDDLLGLRVPLTQLDKEVYGVQNFTIGHDPGERVCFKTPPDVTEVQLGAYKGHLRVLSSDGSVLRDTKTDSVSGSENPGSPFRYCNVVSIPTQPDMIYYIERSCFYIKTNPRLFVCFDPDRWFAPSPQLEEVKWWQLVP